MKGSKKSQFLEYIDLTRCTYFPRVKGVARNVTSVAAWGQGPQEGSFGNWVGMGMRDEGSGCHLIFNNGTLSAKQGNTDNGFRYVAIYPII